MKTIGLLGGMSWQSTITYYRLINQAVNEALGGQHSAKTLLFSVDFAEIEAQQVHGKWDESAAVLSEAAQNLERAGADFLVICTNTMHKVAPQIQAGLSIPVLHIAEATAKVLTAAGITTVGLLGTKYTMTEPFYRDKIAQAGIAVVIPNAQDVERVNAIIFEELCHGVVSEASRQEYVRIIGDLQGRGAQGVILGCTEIGLLIRQADTDLPIFDTAQIHAMEAARYALSGI